MEKERITGNDLIQLGYPVSPVIGFILKKANKAMESSSREAVLEFWKQVWENPNAQTAPEALEALAFLQEWSKTEFIPLVDPKPYAIYGPDYIDEGARRQMEVAMKLPVTVGGALMPDAHHGYGLPIGGVLATENEVIPFGVGVDIGCRMCLSIFDVPEKHFQENPDFYKRELIAFTKFGAGNGWRGREKADHEVLEHQAFYENKFLYALRDKAWAQLGTSGGGNHFVEWGILEMLEEDASLVYRKGNTWHCCLTPVPEVWEPPLQGITPR